MTTDLDDPAGPTTLVDSNVLLDVVTEDATWCAWSASQLALAADSGPVILNPIVYAEISVGYDSIEELDAVLADAALRREALPWPAAFLAGKAYLAYRREGGTRRSPMPDFYIGAHAAVLGHRLLTRDPSRYRTYFPKLELIAP